MCGFFETWMKIWERDEVYYVHYTLREMDIRYWKRERVCVWRKDERQFVESNYKGFYGQDLNRLSLVTSGSCN